MVGGDKRSWVEHTQWRSGVVKGLKRADNLRVLVSGLQSHKIQWMVREMRSWVGRRAPWRVGHTPESGSGEGGGEFVRRSCLWRAVAACIPLQASLSAQT